MLAYLNCHTYSSCVCDGFGPVPGSNLLVCLLPITDGLTLGQCTGRNESTVSGIIDIVPEVCEDTILVILCMGLPISIRTFLK